MLVADSSALYALFNGSDAHHAAARAEASAQRPILVPSEILAETIGLIGDRMGPEEARQVLATLRGLPHVRLAATRQSVLEEALRLFMQGGPLSLEDQIIVATCRSVGTRPWTFDEALRRACKSR